MLRIAPALLLALLLVPAAAGRPIAPPINGLVVYPRYSNQGLAAVDPATGRTHGIAGAHGQADDPTYSPDGRRIAYVRSPGFCFPEPCPEPAPLYVIGAEGGRPQPIVDDADWPSWSPDGSRIAFVHDGGLEVVDADGRHRRTVVARPADGNPVHNPAWSPDGKTIAFWRNVPAPRCCLESVRLDAGTPIALPRAPAAAVDRAPAWSPNSARVAVGELRRCSGGRCGDGPYLTLLPVGGGGARVVLTRGDMPVWSPDGRSIAFVWGGLQVIPATGGRPRRIATLLDLGGLGRFDSHRVSWQPLCTMRGTRRPDALTGSARADLICGLGGDDEITGGAGEDKLFGEDGDDRFLARDGEFDVVGCGPGRDRVTADAQDLVGVDCEVVRRR